LAAIAFLDGDQESRDLWDRSIINVKNRIPSVGWSNATQEFDQRLGLTLYVDVRIDRAQLETQLTDYCRAKVEDTNMPNWIGVGEGATGGLFVVVIERDPETPLADVFLVPSISLNTGPRPSTAT
jgi:hypothetical protein